MKAKLIGGVMMGMLLSVGVSNMAEAQCGRRGGVSFSLNVGAPMGGGYVAAGPAYCPPPPVAYCPPPAPVVYQPVYGRPYYGYGQSYYNRPACGGYGAPVVYNNYYRNGYGGGGHYGHGYNHGGGYGHYGPRGHR